MSWEALLAAGVARLMEELNVAVDISNCTFHYLQSARELQRQVQDDPKSRAYIMQLHQKMSNLQEVQVSTRVPASQEPEKRKSE